MKQVEVKILGQVYMLGCPDGGEALLHKAVAAVDHEMTVIRDAGKVKARERIAVLAALNLAFQLAEQGPPAPAAAVSTPPPQALEEQSPALDALLLRINEVLAEDGQLL
jgi:cell division protein ZapA